MHAHELAAGIRHQSHARNIEASPDFAIGALVAAGDLGGHRVLHCSDQQIALQLAVEPTGRHVRLAVPVAAPAGRVHLQLALLAAAAVAELAQPAGLPDLVHGHAEHGVVAEPPVVAEHLAGRIHADAVVPALRQRAAAGEIPVPATRRLRRAHQAVDPRIQRTPAGIDGIEGQRGGRRMQPARKAAQCEVGMGDAGRALQFASGIDEGAADPCRQRAGQLPVDCGHRRFHALRRDLGGHRQSHARHRVGNIDAVDVEEHVVGVVGQ